MSNIDKQAREVQRYSNFGVDMMEWADGGYVKHCDYLALLDELEAAQKRVAELENDEVRQRLANAEHQLHMAELAKHNLKASRKAQFRKRLAAEKRIAELEARTVTLPRTMYTEFEDDDYCREVAVLDKQQVIEALLAAGIGKGE
ncbi:ead/Ea22-like family protein [Salmonella enterica]|uniref:ead/Ea22-like family protein n=1 Tax=Salmonella enterica TaxID=28901 RepID=UPI0003BDC07F|nr:ead/Ea22-like family protein [Salmonella enterica]ECH6733167.1 ead/Ea22-like family protein [Salmonella enterica subsp. enterica serovar Give]ECS7843708.1 hypothetical protein [Salmonella enterica subsp. enterica serovar Anatum]EAY6012983.1 ead/Ea22-like family protein [Salmonella enterica]EAZ8689442.1 ead/Ea22-like family protein [Salmonella enterica]ECH6800224.1 ead/Ea22-like family protein [Salmonella enterica subsp. enterica serovar Give]